MRHRAVAAIAFALVMLACAASPALAAGQLPVIYNGIYGYAHATSRTCRKGLDHLAAARLVQDEAFERIELPAPWGLLNRLHRVAVTGLTALPDTFGVFASAASTARSVSRELPPERSISPAASPSGSSSKTFRRCSGANCWWPSRSASDCAD